MKIENHFWMLVELSHCNKSGHVNCMHFYTGLSFGVNLCYALATDLRQ